MQIVKVALVASFSVFLTLGTACERSIEHANAATPASAVETAKSADAPAPPVTREPDSRDFVTTAPITVENQIDLLTQREGVVVKIFADIGTPVRKGALLAMLDSRQLEADREALTHNVRANAANVKFHETEQSVNSADLQRAQKMFEAGLMTKEQLEHVRFTHDATVWEIDRERENEQQYAAKIRSLDMEIAKMRIVAPFDGVVGRRYVRVGQRVAPNDRLFWVTAERPLLVRFTVPQQYVASLKKGSAVNVNVPFAADEKHIAKVTAISPVVDPASGTVEVVARLVGTPQTLRPGMTANIHLEKQ